MRQAPYMIVSHDHDHFQSIKLLKSLLFFILMTCSTCAFATSSLDITPVDLNSGSLAFVASTLIEAETNHLKIKRLSADMQAAADRIDTAQAQNLPIISADADLGPSRSWRWNSKDLLAGSDHVFLSLNSGLNIRQNLYAGGGTGREIEKSKLNHKLKQILLHESRMQLAADIAHDLLNISSLHSILLEKQELQDQAQKLEKIASRKLGSGFLGKKELLETKRETFRSSAEKQKAFLKFKNAIATFNRAYHLKTNALKIETFGATDEMQNQIRKLGNEGFNSAQIQIFREQAVQSNLALKRQQLLLNLNDIEIESARNRKTSPSVDVTAGIRGTLYDSALGFDASTLRSSSSNSKTSSLSSISNSAVAPEKELSVFGKLSVSLNLYDPVAWSASNETTHSRTAALLEYEEILQNIDEFSSKLAENQEELEQNLRNQRELITLSEDLQEKSTRLFEAGEYDVLSIITSQKELSIQKQANIENEMQLFQLGLSAAAARELGVMTATSEGLSMGSQGNSP